MTEPAVVVAGDAFIDLTSTTSVTGSPAYEPHPGGSCLNIAVGLGRLGIPTSLLARVSGDQFGRLIREHLADSGVLDSHLIPAHELTGLGVADIVDGKAGYAFHTAEAADRMLRVEDLPDLPDDALLHVGSIALAQEPQATTLDRLVRREARRRLISLDPNVRPGVIADRAAYLDRLAGWVAASDIVKVSDEDLAWLAPGEPPEEVAERWLAAGVALVLITYGADGAWARTARTATRVPARVVEVVDTVGAGDALMSGVLAGLVRGGRRRREDLLVLDEDTLSGVLTAAVEVAAMTCTRAGAQPPFAAELAAFAAPADARELPGGIQPSASGPA